MAEAAAALANEPLLLRSDAGGVATLTLNRPKQYNALSEAMISLFLAAIMYGVLRYLVARARG